jgi:hypothetical protein
MDVTSSNISSNKPTLLRGFIFTRFYITLTNFISQARHFENFLPFQCLVFPSIDD